MERFSTRRPFPTASIASTNWPSISWWSWIPDARSVFRRLDYAALAADRAQPGADAAAACSPRRSTRRRSRPGVRSRSTTRPSRGSTRRGPRTTPGGQRNAPTCSGKSIAYFSAEFALHQSLPIYAGGLGVLAGDHCKEASDLGVPLIGVGFMYPQGYFHQSLSADGWQEEMLRTAQLDRRADRTGDHA